MNYHQILDLILDSRDVTVGGGSASALAGAMAAGLAGMVARLSTGKEYGLTDEEYLTLAERADGLSRDLGDGAVRDSEAFLKIKQAYALPKGTPEEKAARGEAVQQAGIAAATVPLENARKCRLVTRACAELKGKSNPNTASDLQIAEQFSRAGMEGCLLNVFANLPLIKDQTIRAGFEVAAGALKEPEHHENPAL
jgi:formiminotetrahydrofolate cyclodeaminase